MNEKWKEIYTPEQLKKIQNIEIQCLKDFIDTCEQLDIEYFIYGGTLLGCVKYNDIIPWDDDVDVALTRENYERFLNEAPKILPKKYILQTPYNEVKSPWAYTKMRVKGTKLIEEFHNKLDIEKGIYIDIYPVDNIPDDENLRKKQYDKVQKTIKLYYLRQCIHTKFSLKNIKRYFLHSLAYYTLRILPQTYYINKIDSEMKKYNNTNTKRKACLFSPNYENIYIKLYPLKTEKFGKIKVKIPYCYDDHLTKRYGAYKEDLPVEKRIGHIPFEIEF